MANLKLFASAVLAAGLASLPLAAQQTPSPATTGDQAQPSTSGQTVPGNHSDPNATIHTGSGDNQKPTNDNPDPGAGQGTGNPNPTATGGATNGGAMPVQHTASAPEVSNIQLRPVRAQLVGKLDSKDAKAGDQVVLKTTDQATIADGTVIPKGSKIMGQVVEAKPHTGANRNAQVTLQFTQAELKNGQKLPIQSVLQSVAPAGTSEAATDGNPLPSGVMGGGGTASGQSGAVAPANGGNPAQTANTGGTGATMAGSPGMAGSQGMSGAQGVSAGPPAQAQGNMASSQPGVASGQSTVASGANRTLVPGTVVAQQGNIQIKTTAVPGVLVEANADGQPFSNASGALVGAGQNVHLDGGTKVDLAIAAGNQKASQR